MDDYVKRMFLTGTLKYMILNELECEDGLSGYSILMNIRRKVVYLDAGSFYNSIKSLEQRDYVRRTKDENRNAYHYSLTSRGEEFIRQYKILFGRLGGRFDKN